jgi:predicted metal-dependent peptidase
MGVALREFDKNRNKRPDIVVVFTDGYTPWPSEKPSFDTIVGLLSEGDKQCGVPEWAKVVRICEE